MRRLVTSRSARWEQRRFVVEGPRLLAEALAAPLVVHEVFAEDPARWPGATLVRPGTLDRIGDAETSQGVLAVLDAPALALHDADVGLDRRWRVAGSPLVLVVAGGADPGNVGTILRSAEAAGASAVILAGGVDPLSPKVVRAAAGALFRVPVAVVDEVEAALDWLTERGVRCWATVVDGGEDLYRCDLAAASAILLGSEAHGLPPEVLARGDVATLSIPMAGAVESLNVAMAATVVGFEAWRQRRAAPVG